MLKPTAGLRPLRVAAALAATVFLLVIPAVGEAVPPGNSQCNAKYVQSDADDTCQNESVTAQGWNCHVSAECRKGNGTWHNTSITASPNDTTRLNNCDGVLTIGSC